MGGIIGGVAGGIAGVLLGSTVMFFYLKKNFHQRATYDNEKLLP